MDEKIVLISSVIYIFLGLYAAISKDDDDKKDMSDGERILKNWMRTFLWPITFFSSLIKRVSLSLLRIWKPSFLNR